MLTNIAFIVSTRHYYYYYCCYSLSQLVQQVNKVRRVFAGTPGAARSAPWRRPEQLHTSSDFR